MSADENSSIPSDAESISSTSRSQTSLNSSFRSSFASESEAMEQGEYADDANNDPEFKKLFDATKEEYKKAKAQSLAIQTKFMSIFKGDYNTPNINDSSTRYQEALSQFEQKMAELEQAKAQFNSELQAIQEKAEQADKHRLEREKDFHDIREQACKNAIKQRTNKPLTAVEINTKEGKLVKAERDLENSRIQFILTKSKYKQTEEELDQQDQLSEGLHLIDFEQLKIENQSLNEKKAEKLQDLEKIRKKIVDNAHILTHVKEKLHFVSKQKEGLITMQKKIDTDYTEARAKLATARIHRDKVRDDNSNLKKSSGLIGMTDLLYDFENRSNELELMKDKVTELKQKYNDLVAMQHELEAKIAQHPPLDPTLLRMNR